MKTSNYLVFRLYAPLASWGDAAVGGDRPSHTRPTRSALLGLIAAALGIERTEQASLDALSDALYCHIKQYSAGSLLRDFHTAQVPSVDKKTAFYTRKDELGKAKKLNTVLSSRDYREGGLWVVSIESNSEHFSLERVQAALNKPKFMLYLGRKSCPLAAPMCPTLLTEVTLKNALDYAFPPVLGSEKEDSTWLRADKAVCYYWQGEAQDLLAEQVSKVQTHQVRDNPKSRQQWLFGLRTEHQLIVTESA